MHDIGPPGKKQYNNFFLALEEKKLYSVLNKGRKIWENVEIMLVMIVHKDAMASRQLVTAGHAGGRNISSE